MKHFTIMRRVVAAALLALFIYDEVLEVIDNPTTKQLPVYDAEDNLVGFFPIHFG